VQTNGGPRDIVRVPGTLPHNQSVREVQAVAGTTRKKRLDTSSPRPEETSAAPRKRAGRLARLGLTLLAVAVFFSMGGGAAQIVTVFLLFLLSLVPVTVAHELGHLAAARLARFRFVTLLLGPIEIARGPSGLRFSHNRIPHMLGAVMSLPSDERGMRVRMLLIALGGPSANLLLAGVSGALFYALQTGYRPDEPRPLYFVTEFALFVAGVSFAVALLNLLPFGGGGLVTDGAHMVQLLRGGLKADRQYAVALIGNSELVEGERPREWRAEWIQRAIATDGRTPDDPGILKLAYLWAIDCGRMEEAGGYLQRAVDAARKQRHPILPNVLAEKAFHAAFYLQRPFEARALLDSVPHGALVERHARLRAEAAVLLAEEQWESALEHACMGLVALHRAHYMGRFALEEEWLDTIARAAERHKTGQIFDETPR